MVYWNSFAVTKRLREDTVTTARCCYLSPFAAASCDGRATLRKVEMADLRDCACTSKASLMLEARETLGRSEARSGDEATVSLSSQRFLPV